MSRKQRFVLRLGAGLAVFLTLSISFSSASAQFTLLYQKNGPAASNLLGYSVAGIGDVDGDGVPDIIAGAPLAGPGYPVWSGSAFVYSGATGALLYQRDGTAGIGFADQLGVSVAAAGDVNGDGRVDFIVGANNADPGGKREAGAAYVYSGRDGSLLFEKVGADSFDTFGGSVAGAGDVNGDGRADFIIGANGVDGGGQTNNGAAYVYSGATGALLYRKDGPAERFDFGSAVSGAGDVNGDGKADFLVGAHWATVGSLLESGTVFVYSGANGVLLYRKDGLATNAEMGYSVASAGDVNGDGKDDIIIGAPYFPGESPIIGYRGKAYVFSGPTGATIYELNNPDLHDGQFGWSVAGAGDVDGDGRPDLIVGAHSMDVGGSQDVGSAFIFSGATGTLLARIDGPGPNKEFGFSVGGVSDLNDDGKADLLIGAAFADPGNITDAGSVFVYGLPCSGRRGDVNNNTATDIEDIAALIQSIVFETGLPNPLAADANCDGVRDITDIVLLVQYVVFGTPQPCCL